MLALKISSADLLTKSRPEWLERRVEKKAAQNFSNIHYMNLEFLFLRVYFLGSVNVASSRIVSFNLGILY